MIIDINLSTPEENAYAISELAGATHLMVSSDSPDHGIGTLELIPLANIIALKYYEGDIMNGAGNYVIYYYTGSDIPIELPILDYQFLKLQP